MISGRTSLVQALLVCLCCAESLTLFGCAGAKPLAAAAPLVAKVGDGFLEVEVSLEPSGQPGEFLCYARMKNCSHANLLVIDSPSGDDVMRPPMVSYLPGAIAELCYGLRKMPDWAFYIGEESFWYRVIGPGDGVVYKELLTNPLRERDFYGSDIYDWRRSGYYGKRPKRLEWQQVRVRIGYIVMGKTYRVANEDDGISASSIVVTPSGDRSALELQRTIICDLTSPKGTITYSEKPQPEPVFGSRTEPR